MIKKALAGLKSLLKNENPRRRQMRGVEKNKNQWIL